MKNGTLWMGVFLALPLAFGAAAALARSVRGVLNTVCAGMALTVSAGVGLLFAWRELPGRVIETAGAWFRMDALSAYHLAVLMLVYGCSTLYARIYFGRETEAGRLSLRSARVFGGLWCAAFASMALVLLSNNVGIMWVSIEATTLITAFLICVHMTRESLEAMWKYIVICSVGVAFAFVGETLVAAAGRQAGLAEGDMLLMSRLTAASASLSPALIKIGFLFVLVGYGAKAGLAPMHNWLPDAHSQAPAPVSAIFSGFMLNTALYCIVRHMPMVNGATGASGWANGLLVAFGLFSIVLAAGFIIFQRDLKRLLAYSSVEHMGIVALGLGLGGFGTLAALFHMLNHSIAKTLAFFAAGRLGQCYGTHDMSRMTGAIRTAPAWGVGILVGILALIGMAPFAPFMSELQILVAAASTRAVAVAIVFLGGVAVAFVGALRYAIAVAWGEPPGATRTRTGGCEWAFPLVMGGLLLVLGLWMPGPLMSFLRQAAAVVQGTEGVPTRAVTVFE